jgi:hypothetical protein
MHIFFFFSILHKLYGEVAKELRRQDPHTEFSGLLYGVEQLRDLQRSGFPSQQLSVFTQELRRRLPHTHDAVDFLRSWEKSHAICFNTLLSSDRAYSKFPREEGLRVSAVAIHVCEDLLERRRPDIIVAEGADDLLSQVLYYCAREHGVPYLITYASPTPGRIAIYSNLENHWERVEEIFAHFRGSSPSEEQKIMAQALVAEYREKHLLPTYLKAGFNRLYSGRELHSLWRVALRHWLDSAHRLDPSCAGSLPMIVAQKLQRTLRAACASRSFQQPKKQERFVLFPLQLEPECSTLVFAPFHANQSYLVECLSKSLPIDYWLYVKEHPAMLGRRALSCYRAMRALPNVKLISPKVSSHELIEQASVVVTVTSSVGWEALMHAKPVIVLGNVWYDAFDLVQKVRTTADLPAALQRAIFDHHPDEDLLLKFVVASLEGTYPGQIEHPDYSPEVLSPPNAAAVDSAIRQHLAWLRSVSFEPRARAARRTTSVSGTESRLGSSSIGAPVHSEPAHS